MTVRRFAEGGPRRAGHVLAPLAAAALRLVRSLCRGGGGAAGGGSDTPKAQSVSNSLWNQLIEASVSLSLQLPRSTAHIACKHANAPPQHTEPSTVCAPCFILHTAQLHSCAASLSAQRRLLPSALPFGCQLRLQHPCAKALTPRNPGRVLQFAHGALCDLADVPGRAETLDSKP